MGSGDIVTVTGRIEEIGLKGVIQVSLVGENQKRGKSWSAERPSSKQAQGSLHQQGDPPSSLERGCPLRVPSGSPTSMSRSPPTFPLRPPPVVL